MDVELLCGDVLVGDDLLCAICELVHLIIESIVAVLELEHHPASVIIQSVGVHADYVLSSRLRRQICRLLKVFVDVVNLFHSATANLVCALQELLELLARHVVNA